MSKNNIADKRNRRGSIELVSSIYGKIDIMMNVPLHSHEKRMGLFS